MNLLCLVVPLLAATPLMQGLQDGDSDIRFHRVHLTNGNFIDGHILKETTSSILLKLKVGEMTIRRDMINKVEFVKMRDRNETPLPVDLVDSKGKEGKKEGGKEDIDRTTVAVETPEALKKKVDLILFKFKNSPAGGDDREIPFQEIAALGEDAAVYLASRIPAFDLKTQDAMAVALINLNNLKRSARVDKVLEGYLAHDSAAVRAASVNVLSTGASEQEKLRLFKSMLKDRDRSVRITVMSCLGSVEDRQWFDVMAEVSADTDPDIRNRAIRLLRILADKHELIEQVNRQMVSNLRSSDGGVVIDALHAIGLLQQKEAWKDVLPMLRASDAPVRVAALRTVSNLGSPEVAEELVSLVSSERDLTARGALAAAIQKYRPIKAVEPLIDWLRDSEKEVQKMAEATLRIVTSENLGSDPEKWQEWWDKNKPN
jgi:HEAT repeat protein